MVLEFLPGGELFSLLARERRLKEEAAAFYAAMVRPSRTHDTAAACLHLTRVSCRRSRSPFRTCTT